jgi:predicted DCC family thiol-disulfide oxidoreductase YuxK
MRKPVSNPIVLYDGVCGLCNRGVQFLLKRDRRGQLRYASLQSGFAAALLGKHGIDSRELNTIYVVVDYGLATESLLVRADAVSFLGRAIGGVWNALRLLKILPKWAGDRAYDLVARYRYRVFGKYDSCQLVDDRHRHKFLDESEKSKRA